MSKKCKALHLTVLPSATFLGRFKPLIFIGSVSKRAKIALIYAESLCLQLRPSEPLTPYNRRVVFRQRVDDRTIHAIVMFHLFPVNSIKSKAI